MSTTLLALYRRPEGGRRVSPRSCAATRRSTCRSSARCPACVRCGSADVVRAFGQSDLVLVARLIFDDRAALDVALASEPMRAAGRNLREIAPGIVTMVVVEPDHGLSHGEGGEGGHDGA